VITKVEQTYSVDKGRVYVVGHSNGGGMTFAMAMADADEIAAIGMVAPQPFAVGTKPSRSVPTIDFMGTDDPLIPPAGGIGNIPTIGKVPVPSSDIYLPRWAQLNGFPTPPTVVKDDSVATRKQFGPDFQTILVKGQGHMWPRLESTGRAGGFGMGGKEALTVDGTGEMWAFLKRYSR